MEQAIGIAGLINSIINPPHRAAQISAETEIQKAKIAAQVQVEVERMRLAASADKVAPILDRWGVIRVTCTPGAVFINDLGNNSNTVCIKPNQAIAAGYYTYDGQRGVLLRNSTSRLTIKSSVNSRGF
jgi:hypothetical protein